MRRHEHECPVCGDTWDCWADECGDSGSEEQVCPLDQGDYDEDPLPDENPR